MLITVGRWPLCPVLQQPTQPALTVDNHTYIMPIPNDGRTGRGDHRPTI